MPKVNVKTVNEVSIKIREHEVQTTSKYAVYYVKTPYSAEKIELTDKLKLHWDDDQTPFFQLGTKMYQCHHGNDINEYQKRKYAQHRDKMAQEDHCFIKKYNQAQTSKKLGCPAKIHVIRMIKMFEYKLTGPTYTSAKNKVSRLIKKKVAEGVPIGEEMYVINFPNEDDHKYHLQGNNAAAVEPVDQRVREHIEKIVFRGERNPIVVSKLLEIFVEQELQEIDRKRRRFYPDLETVRKIISHVKGKLKQSPIDQVNTEVLLGKIDFVEASTSSNENSDEASEEQNDMREEFVENRCDYQNIPSRGSKRKIMINECNATIRSIQSALLYVKEEKILKHLTSLKEVLADITSDMSVDDKCGLPIQPDPPKKLRRDPDTDQPTKKYNKLPLNKQKKAFSGRVGFVADQLKSASKVPFNN